MRDDGAHGACRGGVLRHILKSTRKGPRSCGSEMAKLARPDPVLGGGCSGWMFEMRLRVMPLPCASARSDPGRARTARHWGSHRSEPALIAASRSDVTSATPSAVAPGILRNPAPRSGRSPARSALQRAQPPFSSHSRPSFNRSARPIAGVREGAECMPRPTRRAPVGPISSSWVQIVRADCDHLERVEPCALKKKLVD